MAATRTRTIGRKLKLKEAAKYVGVTRQTLTRWIKAGEGPPFYTLGNRKRFDADDLDRWLEGRKQG